MWKEILLFLAVKFELRTNVEDLGLLQLVSEGMCESDPRWENPLDWEEGELN